MTLYVSTLCVFFYVFFGLLVLSPIIGNVIFNKIIHIYGSFDTNSNNDIIATLSDFDEISL